MKVLDILDKFSFTNSHINYININSKYGIKELHRDEISFLSDSIRNAEVLSISVTNKPDGYYTKAILEIHIDV